ncbi:MAG: LexA regulated protein [Moritella sp.]|uniref:LexA regulated protein n=1 Tax=Moritella sp. TaxID=78556 RepID=UPI001DF693A6|nr:LexA regulated protein [Moritella sp.]NQZ51795.1 LexA regulated protein [Moritella sp.]
MAKENLDRTTIDLFAEEKRAGRPKTNPLSRKEQLKYNKRNQLSRDKANGLKRIELKVEQDLFDMLNMKAKSANMTRSEYIQQLLHTHVAR